MVVAAIAWQARRVRRHEDADLTVAAGGEQPLDALALDAT